MVQAADEQNAINPADLGEKFSVPGAFLRSASGTDGLMPFD
jgi:hypothetical protein